jgi:phospholipase/lecithinase/hemolysin
MQTLERMAIALLAILPLMTGTAFAETELGYSRIFVFGDSFSDPGNHFAVTGETAHPPFTPLPTASYGVGGHHFTDGRTWIEVLAQEMNLEKWAKPAYRDPAFGNYAYAYARARAYSPIGPSFGEQVLAWMDAGYCIGAPMNDTLFVVQFGANDLADALEAYLAGADPTPILGGAVESIAANIGMLAGCGAHNILVANAPDPALTQLVPPAFKAAVTAMTMDFNDTVEDVLSLYFGGLNLSILDTFGIGNAFATMPETFGFRNVTDPCLNFGVIKNAFCKDRDGYLFWDTVHLTKRANALIADIALGQLPVIQ